MGRKRSRVRARDGERPPRARADDASRALLAALVLLVESIVDARASSGDWYTQATSPFGRARFLRLCRAGAMPAAKVGRTWLVRRADFDRFVEAHAE